MKRLFVAATIAADPEIIGFIEHLKLSLAHEKISWVKDSQLHFTLRFFGETADKDIPPIISAIELAAACSESLTLKLSGLGIFGSRYDPKVIWLGLQESSALNTLHHNLVAELQKINLFPDRQNFVPHITLGRIRKKLLRPDYFQERIQSFKKVHFAEQKLHHIVLFESKLLKSGPEYLTEADFELKTRDKTP